ncbi:MAG: right-handed parallel beta-helix repeat-containing protein [Candidatus Methanomethylicaceae archaeon]
MNLKRLIQLIGAGLVLAWWNSSLMMDPMQECTVTLRPGQSIQKAIDEVALGSVICLASGRWRENIMIAKSLTLRGAGRGQTIIQGKEVGKSAIFIKNDSEIDVVIERLTAEQTYGGLEVQGEARVMIQNSLFSKNTYGLAVGGSAKVAIVNSVSLGNSFDGLFAGDSAEVTIENSSFSGNENGIFIGDSASLTVLNSSFAANQVGIWIWDSANIIIEGSTFSGNRYDGLRLMKGSGNVEIHKSHFLRNKRCGISVGSAEAKISGTPNEMKDNGADLCGFVNPRLRQPLVPQTDKTALTVPSDYNSIQEAIDAIAPGGVVTITGGTYFEGLTIWKPVKLIGVGWEQTTIMPLPGRSVVISIPSESKEVYLQGLKITGGQKDEMLIYGEAILRDIVISLLGSTIGGFAGVIIENSVFSENYYSRSLVVTDSANVTIKSSIFSKNLLGLSVWRFARVTIQDSAFLENWSTLGVSGYGIVVIENSRFLGSAISIDASDYAQVTVENSSFSKNDYGPWVNGSASLTIKNSQIFNNYSYGILIAHKAQAHISNNRIFSNKGYGVALAQRPCYDILSTFEGRIEGSGNAIELNAKGNLCPSECSYWPEGFGGGC